MKKIVLDLEANFSLLNPEDGTVIAHGENLREQVEEYTKDRLEKGLPKIKPETDFATAFNSLNRVVMIGAYTPHNDTYSEYYLEEDDITPLKEFIENEAEMIIGQNIKYDVHWLNKLGIKTNHLVQDDTQTREYILRGGRDTMRELGLDKLAPTYGGTNKVEIIKPLWSNWINNSEIDRNILSTYQRADVWNTWKVWVGQEKHPNNKRFKNMLNMKRALNGAVQRMEYNGIHANRDKALEIKDNFKSLLKEVEIEMYDSIEKVVAPKALCLMPSGLTPTKKAKFRAENEDEYVYDSGSNKDKMRLLYGLEFKQNGEKVAFKVGKTTQNLYPSEIEWREQHKNIRNATELRRLVEKCFDKLPESFGVKPIPNREVIKPTGFSSSKKAIEALNEQGGQTKKATHILNLMTRHTGIQVWIGSNINSILVSQKDDGKIHAGFNITGTISGRFSSSKPNMQNLPSKKKNGGENNVRECVVSRFGKEGCIVAIDYSQLELRYVMEYTNCTQGIQDYIAGVDMHEATARMVYDSRNGEGAFDKLSETDYKYWRGEAKTVNFGLLYGARPKGDTQQALSDAFFERYPEVTTWHNLVEDLILAKGYYVSPITGWAYNFKGANRDNFWSGFSGDKGWRNRSRNIPIQGGGNEVIQLANIAIDEELKNDEDILLIGQVHDELLFDCKKISLDRCLNIGYKHMEKLIAEHYMLWFGYKLRVPFCVEAEVGEDWFNMKEIECK